MRLPPETYQFLEEDIVVMTDDSPEVPQDLQPTRANMLSQLSRFVEDARPGDTFVFLYVGHTESLPSHLRDEHDDMDETIVTMYSQGVANGFILDYELNELLVNPLPAGARLTESPPVYRAFMISSRSSTLLDLPHHCSEKSSSLSQHQTFRAAPPLVANRRQSSSPAVPIVLAVTFACNQDNASDVGPRTGGLVEALIETLQETPRPSLNGLVTSLRRYDLSPVAMTDSELNNEIFPKTPQADSDDTIQISSTLPFRMSDIFTLVPIHIPVPDPGKDLNAEVTHLQTELRDREAVMADMKVQHIKETSHLHEQIKNLTTTLTESKAAHDKDRRSFQEQIDNLNKAFTETKANIMKANEGFAAAMQSAQMVVSRASTTSNDRVATQKDTSEIAT
ncbi:Metacaspase [Steccherinum ochraceum]|uniref:Metacaspase n=1 Tax=Steccherinum ochraceum TaxID=92696 RepID=A0A4R0RC48_9APHY|nr:Metacaspase [Steccherinum ochraceum]